MIRAALVAAALALTLTGAAPLSETTAPVPHACHIIASGDGETTSGADFWSWRDSVSEDGRLNYNGRGDSPAGVWTLDLWHNAGTETLGYSVEEDGDIWNTMDCASSRTPSESRVGGTMK